MDQLEKTALQTIKSYRLLEKGNHVVVGLSGGADSVSLLLFLLSISREQGIQVSAAHLNHGLRPGEAERDEAFSRSLCERLEVRFECFHADVAQRAKAAKITVEEAGRNARYEAFQKALEKIGADKVAVAHHQNDNAETILMHMMRGAGLAGLCGMPARRGNLIRPLLYVSRAEIEAYLMEKGQTYVRDSTNEAGEYSRNRVRLNLIPLIQADYNPKIVEALCRQADILREDDAALAAWAESAFNDVLLRKDETAAELDAAGLLKLPNAVLRRVVRRTLAGLSAGLKDVTFAHTAKVCGLLSAGTGKRIALPRGVTAEMRYDRLVLRLNMENAPLASIKVPVVNGVWAVFLKQTGQTLTFSTEKHKNKLNCGCAKTFRYDTIKDGLEIRSRKPGDRIFVRKMGGHKKLSDYMTDRKIPRDARDKIPLLAFGSDILWILDDKRIPSDAYLAEPGEEHTITVQFKA